MRRRPITNEKQWKLSLARVQLIKCALQLFQLLSGFTELAFRGQALVFGKVFGGFRDKRAAILCGLGRRGGCRCASRGLSGDWRGAQRRYSSAKKSRHRRLEGRSVRQAILQREHDQTQLR